MYLDSIVDTLSKWFEDNELEKYFHKILVFGSILNQEGRLFIPTGIVNSDIDILLIFSDKCDSVLDRFSGCQKIRECKRHLEIEGARILGRTELNSPIFSTITITEYEIYHGIHKGFDPKIFTTNIFYNVLEKEQIDDGLTDYVDFAYHFENIEAFSAIRLCQKIRSEYTKVNAVGNSTFRDFSSEEPLPKELMRTAALINFIDTDMENDQDRTNIILGTRFIEDSFKTKSKDNEIFRRLYEKIQTRSFNRPSDMTPLTPDDILLVCELLYDEARERVPRSVREAIDQAISMTTTPSD